MQKTLIIRIFSLYLFFLISGEYSIAQDIRNHSLFDNSTMQVINGDSSVINKGAIVCINKALKHYVMSKIPKHVNISIALSPDNVIQTLLELSLVSNGDIKVINAYTKERLTAPKYVCYRGRISGNNHSLVAITFTDTQIIGIVSDSTGDYTIGKYSNIEGASIHIIYHNKDLRIKNNFKCGKLTWDSSLPHVRSHIPSKHFNSLQSESCRALKIDFYCDFALYQQFSNNSMALSEYIVGMFNVVGYIYALESVHMLIDEIVIFTSSDPFSNNSTDAALGDLGNYISTNGYNGNLVHLLTIANGGGGLAYLNSDLCDNNDNHACGVSSVSGSFQGGYGNIPLYQWDIYVVAHELGHNLGSPHTHNYSSWLGCIQIDNCMDDSDPDIALMDKVCHSNMCPGGCWDGPMPGTNGGTIMSYCHLISGVQIALTNRFGSQPGNKIRDSYFDAWDCLEEYPLDWRTQNYTFSSPTFQYYGRFIFAGRNVINNQTQGPVIMNFTTGSTTWQTGRAIYLKEGFHKSNSGTFNARILNMLDCFNQYSFNNNDHKAMSVSSTQITASGFQNSPRYFTPVTSDDIFVLPNPANTNITIRGKNLQSIEVYSSLGTYLFTIDTVNPTVEITHLTSGSYYVRCKTSNSIVVKPFVIVR